MAIKGKLETYNSLYIDNLSLADIDYFEQILNFFLVESESIDDFPKECYDLANDLLALVKLE